MDLKMQTLYWSSTFIQFWKEGAVSKDTEFHLDTSVEENTVAESWMLWIPGSVIQPHPTVTCKLNSECEHLGSQKCLGQDALEVSGDFPLAFTPCLSLLELLELWGTKRYRIQVGPIPLISQDCQFCPHLKKIYIYIIFVIKTIYYMQMRKCAFSKGTRWTKGKLPDIPWPFITWYALAKKIFLKIILPALPPANKVAINHLVLFKWKLVKIKWN